MLDSSLRIGGLSHSLGLEYCLQQGSIKNVDDLEFFMRSQLYPGIAHLEGTAMMSLYDALQSNDYWRVALIDKLVRVHRTPPEQVNQAKTIGKRLLKLAHAIHPWMTFKKLERLLSQYSTWGCLCTIHTWINYELNLTMEEAFKSYLHSAITCCTSSAAKYLHVDARLFDNLVQTLVQEIEQEWHDLRQCPSKLESLPPFSSSLSKL